MALKTDTQIDTSGPAGALTLLLLLYTTLLVCCCTTSYKYVRVRVQHSRTAVAAYCCTAVTSCRKTIWLGGGARRLYHQLEIATSAGVGSLLPTVTAARDRRRDRIQVSRTEDLAARCCSVTSLLRVLVVSYHTTMSVNTRTVTLLYLYPYGY